MKAIVSGKRYDTETASLVAAWSNSYSSNDFHFCEEDLYRTEKGAWFVHGSGGAASSWARPSGGNGRTGGEGICVLTADDARRWLEDHRKVEELERYFSVEDA